MLPGTRQQQPGTYLEEALGCGTTCVDHPLRDPLTVKVGQLLHKVVVLKQDGATGTHCVDSSAGKKGQAWLSVMWLVVGTVGYAGDQQTRL